MKISGETTATGVSEAARLRERAAGAEAEREAVPLAHEAIHETVAEVLGAQAARGALLDVPAGEGALAARLLRAGFAVRCCDLYPQIFRLPGVEIKGGDLSATLPYPDESFDFVTCVEGLEHIENPQQAVREFARLLRAGGQLVVTVPNILNIEERVKWLLHGYTSHFKPISREALARVRAEHGALEEMALHINPISYAELRYTLEKYGFEIVRLYRDKPKAHLWLYWPLVALIRLVARFAPVDKRRERWTAELQSDEILLGGNTLIVHAVKGANR
ncbi:MAG TPA: methyltransferase domain-containing protein [Pyrinomonadaceae bacterium]|jgi:SAM-dependent methyltransferase|nr:methyltransferase domain-containing protein [Pyrinomonadaceae bacterium]